MTLRENNLKEIKGGVIMESQGILVANKRSLMDRPGLLQVGGQARTKATVGALLQQEAWLKGVCGD